MTLTAIEKVELEDLERKQSSTTRWLSQEEYDRIQRLRNRVGYLGYNLGMILGDMPRVEIKSTRSGEGRIRTVTSSPGDRPTLVKTARGQIIELSAALGAQRLTEAINAHGMTVDQLNRNTKAFFNITCKLKRSPPKGSPTPRRRKGGISRRKMSWRV